MKTAIQIIRDAYAYCGVHPITDPLPAEYSREGLNFLNELLYKLNMENYFPFAMNTIDAKIKGGSATIKPEGDFDGPIPHIVSKVYYKNGTMWEPLFRMSYENIWSRRNTGSVPTYYAFSHEADGSGLLTFDTENTNYPMRVIYNRALAEMGFNDTLNAPPQYEQLLKYGIADKCCIRYGLPADSLQLIRSEYYSMLGAIEKQNSFKHEVNNNRRGGWISPSELVDNAYRM